jgi:CPA2 family monovalent cation:H+ antiporter-2
MGRARAGAVDSQLAPLATAYVLLMAIIGPIAARVVEPVATAVQRRVRPTPA